jgi:hypothetical protein
LFLCIFPLQFLLIKTANALLSSLTWGLTDIDMKKMCGYLQEIFQTNDHRLPCFLNIVPPPQNVHKMNKPCNVRHHKMLF